MDENKNGVLTGFAEEEEVRERLKSRLTQDRKPQTAQSTGSWVDWNAEARVLGQPFDFTKIPLNKLEQMRRDPILAFGLLFVKVPLIRAPWYIKCSDPRIGAAVDASLREIYGRFILAYCNAFDFGFSPMVKRFKTEPNPDWTYVPKDDSMADEQPVWTDKTVSPIVWKPFTALNPRYCTPHWNSKGEFNGIDFKTDIGYGSPFFNSGYPLSGGPSNMNQKRIADIPLEWALWATNEKDSEYGSLWGYPRIGHAYRFWWSYWYKFGVADRAFEKWGDPSIIVYHPDDTLATDVDGNAINYTAQGLALAESIRSGANVTLPSGVVASLGEDKLTSVREWSIEQLESKTDFSSTIELFEYLDVQKLRSVMVPEQALIEGKGGTSSRNVASTFGDLFQESLAVVKEEIDDHLNRFVIPQFVELNFGADAPKAKIVTTGFDSADMDTMKEVIRLIGQRKLLALVNDRELLKQIGIPTVSRTEMNRRLAESAIEAESGAPPAIEASEESAGINERGKYFGPQEHIYVREPRGAGFIIERVDELPETDNGPPAALFDTQSRTLFITKDANADEVKRYMVQHLASEATHDGETLPSETDIAEIRAAIEGIDSKMNEIASKDTNIRVELANDKQPQKLTKWEIVRDEEGWLSGLVEEEIEEISEEESE